MVEDEALVRLLIVEVIEDAGHAVRAAADGEDALAIVRETADLDMIISDVRMPKMDGFELARAARALRPGISLLFMTGYSKDRLPAELADAKILQKPFDPDSLVPIIEEMLARRA